jgi:hypothetical protein
VEIAQQAASKILMAKYAERYKDPAYDALKGILTDGQEYVNDLIQAEKNKVIDAEKQLEEATKAGDAQKIAELKAYIDANKAYKDINVRVTEPKQKYAQTLESLEKKVAEFKKQERLAVVLKPHEDFNKAMVAARKEVADLDVRIDARRNELTLKRASYAKDDEMQILEATRAAKLAEIEGAKKDYLASLDRDVEEGRITAHFKEMRDEEAVYPLPYQSGHYFFRHELLPFGIRNIYPDLFIPVLIFPEFQILESLIVTSEVLQRTDIYIAIDLMAFTLECFDLLFTEILCIDYNNVVITKRIKVFDNA